MVERKTWKEFREAGLLWWINMILHTFGWAIVVDLDEDGSIIDAYPARVKFRGFQQELNDIGYRKVSEYLKSEINDLTDECDELSILEDIKGDYDY